MSASVFLDVNREGPFPLFFDSGGFTHPRIVALQVRLVADDRLKVFVVKRSQFGNRIGYVLQERFAGFAVRY